MDCLTHRWTNMVQLFYTNCTGVDEIFNAKVAKGGIRGLN